MLRVKSRLTFCAVVILNVATAGSLGAQEPRSDRPATVAEAASMLDLETFPLMPGGKSARPRLLASLGYAAKGDPRGGYSFQKKTLEERGWKELPGGYLSDTSCSGAFGKEGYTVSVSASPGFGPDAAGLVEIQLMNHGNVDLSKLPVPADAKLVYSFPTTTAYVTEKSVKETSEALRKLLTTAGWEPYGTAGDSLFFKKNAVRITVWPAVAPAQGNKTMIQLGSVLLSADLPAPPLLIDASYSDTTKTLSLQVDMTPEALTAFYREAMGKAGWKPTTENTVKVGFEDVQIFRNDAKDMATLTMHKVEGKLRANLKHQSAAEVAEELRLASAAEAKRKEESAPRTKKAAKSLVAVAVALPDGAKGVAHKKDRLEFKLAAGKAQAVVQTIRADLLEKGWEQALASLEPMAGTVMLRKKGGGFLTIVYVETGLHDAEVTISTVGAEIEAPKPK